MEQTLSSSFTIPPTSRTSDPSNFPVSSHFRRWNLRAKFKKTKTPMATDLTLSDFRTWTIQIHEIDLFDRRWTSAPILDHPGSTILDRPGSTILDHPGSTILDLQGSSTIRSLEDPFGTRRRRDTLSTILMKDRESWTDLCIVRIRVITKVLY